VEPEATPTDQQGNITGRIVTHNGVCLTYPMGPSLEAEYLGHCDYTGALVGKVFLSLFLSLSCIVVVSTSVILGRFTRSTSLLSTSRPSNTLGPASRFPGLSWLRAGTSMDHEDKKENPPVLHANCTLEHLYVTFQSATQDLTVDQLVSSPVCCLMELIPRPTFLRQLTYHTGTRPWPTSDDFHFLRLVDQRPTPRQDFLDSPFAAPSLADPVLDDDCFVAGYPGQMDKTKAAKYSNASLNDLAYTFANFQKKTISFGKVWIVAFFAFAFCFCFCCCCCCCCLQCVGNRFILNLDSACSPVQLHSPQRCHSWWLLRWLGLGISQS